MNAPVPDHSAETAVTRVVTLVWHRTSAIERALLVGVLLAALGVFTSRVDVVLLSLPLLVWAALGVDRRPVVGTSSSLRIDVTRHSSSLDQQTFSYRIAVEPPPHAELVHLRMRSELGEVREMILVGRAEAVANGEHVIRHSGRQRIIELSYRVMGVDGAWVSVPSPVEVAERVVSAPVISLREIPLPFRLTGLTGMHASARPGDGGEFRDLHPYAPGDRLRRIDWKATARRSQGFGDLYVRRTDATADATVMLVMDTRDDACERVEGWSGTFDGDGGLNALDLAREAAASLAVAAVAAGDRVGFIDLAAQNGVVAAGGGKRHLDRVLRCIATTTPAGQRVSRRRAPIVPRGATIYLMSTFLDDEVVALARLWRASGHRVIAVDVLPALDVQHTCMRTRAAHHILMAERRHRLAVARAHGCEDFRWQDNSEQASRAVALRALSRAGRRR